MSHKKTIQAKNIRKHFRIGCGQRRGALAWVLSTISGRQSTRDIVVLDGVTFEARSGEIIGLIGANGSGKSTLLRALAGIFPIDDGTIDVDGHIGALINLGTGLKERLTMRDNIFLVGSLFGMTSRSIRQQFDSIVSFAQLDNFVDTKIHQFSSGMLQRLAFAIAIHAGPDILLLDEVFEVGDELFKKKSAEHILSFAHSGGTVLFVTHDLASIERQCTRVLVMDNGSIVYDGSPSDAVRYYRDLLGNTDRKIR